MFLPWAGARPTWVLRAAQSKGLGPSLNAAGCTALAGILWLFCRTDQYSGFLYQGGLVLLSVLTVILIASVVVPGTATGTVLGSRPLRWLGARSYGRYVWHALRALFRNPRDPQPQNAASRRGVLEEWRDRSAVPAR